jgi:hypothetical protein
MSITIPQFKYNINEDFNSTDKAEQLAEQIFGDRNEYEAAVKAHLELRGQIADLETRIAALKGLGATINYSKYTALENELKKLQKIERSQPQISEYLKPIPAPAPVYAEKPVNTYIPKIEIPKVATPTVSKTESSNLSQTEDLKLPLGLTIGAVSLVALLAIGFSSAPKNEVTSGCSYKDFNGNWDAFVACKKAINQGEGLITDKELGVR